MSSKSKRGIVRAANDLSDAVERFMGDSILPEAGGLGTDGTCWTDSEMREWLTQLAKNLARAVKKLESKL